MSRSARLLAAILVLFTAFGPALSESPSEVVERARQNLLAAKIDEATAELDALLARPDLENDVRVAALALRAQARAATGKHDAVEEDYRAILGIRPSFSPDPLATSKRALARFETARDALVGILWLDVRPKDATILVDGVAVAPSPEGKVPVLAGERRVRVERRGHDPAELAVTVPPAQTVSVHAELVPNARAVVIRTEPEGVRVLLDDVPVGTTARPAAADPVQRATGPAELLLDAVPAGEHVFVLEKPCYRTVRVREIVSVDVLDSSPRAIGPIPLEVARTTIALAGMTPAAEVRIDGERVPVSDTGGIEACVGERHVEVRAGGRVVWTGRIEVPLADRFELDVSPRPNAVLVGAPRWPAALAASERAFSTRAILEIPEGSDLTESGGWARTTLPPDTDLAIAVIPHDGAAGGERWVLFSPLLKRTVRLAAPPEPARPRLTIPSAGLSVVDDAGEVVVAALRDGGGGAVAAVRPGERVLSVDGRAVASARAFHDSVLAADPGGTSSLRVALPGAPPRDVTVALAPSPLVGAFPEEAAGRAIHAAWCASIGAAGGPDAPAARTDLGLLLEAEGLGAVALDAWRRAAWPARSGVGAGTVDYLAGRVLADAGREEEAREALRRAAAAAAQFGNDDGPEIAPAAADRLADLGVAR